MMKISEYRISEIKWKLGKGGKHPLVSLTILITALNSKAPNIQAETGLVDDSVCNNISHTTH